MTLTKAHLHTVGILDTRPRRRRVAVNVSLDPALLERARELDIPLSATFEAALVERIRVAQAAVWLRENAEAIRENNERIEGQGTFSNDLRSF